MKYKVKIGTPNKMFFIKGKLVRSPLEWIANESELKDIRIKIASEGINDYSIIKFDPDKIAPTKQKSLTIEKQTKTKKVITQETEKKSTTILDKLLDENE